MSTTVGISSPPDVVPSVKSAGPTPRIPSTPVKPVAVEAAPIPWFLTVNEPRITLSMYSSPEKDPDPYETETVSPVSFPVFWYRLFDWAPTHVLEDPVSTIKL